MGLQNDKRSPRVSSLVAYVIIVSLKIRRRRLAVAASVLNCKFVTEGAAHAVSGFPVAGRLLCARLLESQINEFLTQDTGPSLTPELPLTFSGPS